MTFADAELTIGTLAGVVGTVVGVRGWQASKRATKAEVRVALLEAVVEYEEALASLKKRFLSSGLAIRPGDRGLISQHLPGLKAARDRLAVALHRAKPGEFRFCRQLAELDIRTFDAQNVSHVVGAVQAARADAVAGGSRLPISDGENYEIISVEPRKVLS